MAERNKIKLRTCKNCNKELIGTARQIMEHFRECQKITSNNTQNLDGN